MVRPTFTSAWLAKSWRLVRRPPGGSAITVWAPRVDGKSPRPLDSLSRCGEEAMRSCDWPDSTTRRAWSLRDTARTRARADAAPHRHASQQGEFQGFPMRVGRFSSSRQFSIAFQHHAKGVNQVFASFVDGFPLCDSARDLFDEGSVAAFFGGNEDRGQIHTWRSRTDLC